MNTINALFPWKNVCGKIVSQTLSITTIDYEKEKSHETLVYSKLLHLMLLFINITTSGLEELIPKVLFWKICQIKTLGTGTNLLQNFAIRALEKVPGMIPGIIKNLAHNGTFIVTLFSIYSLMILHLTRLNDSTPHQL